MTNFKFRHRPTEVEAVQLCGNFSVEPTWFTEAKNTFRIRRVGYVVEVDTLEGTMTADFTDWIVRGTAGELYAVRDEIFRQTYDPLT